LISVGTTRSSIDRATGSVAALITFSSSLIAARFIGHSAMSLSGFKMLMHSLVLMTRASTVVHSSVALSTFTSPRHQLQCLQINHVHQQYHMQGNLATNTNSQWVPYKHCVGLVHTMPNSYQVTQDPTYHSQQGHGRAWCVR